MSHNTGDDGRSTTTAALLAILAGTFGAHHFYLGNTRRAWFYVAFCFTGLPTVIGFVEGLYMLGDSFVNQELLSWDQEEVPVIQETQATSENGLQDTEHAKGDDEPMSAGASRAGASRTQSIGRLLQAVFRLASFGHSRTAMLALAVFSLVAYIVRPELILSLIVVTALYAAIVAKLDEIGIMATRRSRQLAGAFGAAVFAVFCGYLVLGIWDRGVAEVLVRRANHDYMAGEYETAVEEYQSAMIAGGNQPATRARLRVSQAAVRRSEIVSLVSEGKYTLAAEKGAELSALVDKIQTGYLSPEYAYDLENIELQVGELRRFSNAHVAMQEQRFEDAISILEALLDSSSDSQYVSALAEARAGQRSALMRESESQYMQGVTALQDGEYAAARVHFSNVSSEDTEHYELAQNAHSDATEQWSAELVAKSEEQLSIGVDLSRIDEWLWRAKRLEVQPTRVAELSQRLSEERESRRQQQSVTRSTVEARRATFEAQREAARLRNARVLYDDVGIKASGPCERAVQSLARYDYEWTDGVFGMKFPDYLSSVKREGVLTLVGNSLKLQNGFGAWRHVRYWCDYDVSVGFVVDAGVFE